MIKIVTDTAADITLRQAAELDVEIVSLGVMFGELPYDQLQDETFESFYEQLEASKELPVTSQPSPSDYLAVFSRAKQAGDEVIVIALSSKLSGTVQSATIAREMAGYDKIHIIDSLQAVIGQRLLVEYACKLRKEGRAAQEIVDAITDARERIVLYGALDTLKYLRKGGRIPKTAEMIGTMMGIKPVVELTEGALIMAGKARGHAGAVTQMFKLVNENTDFDPAAPIYFGYTYNDQHCKAFQKLCVQKFHLKETVICPVGAVIGTHVGPRVFAIAYLAKHKEK